MKVKLIVEILAISLCDENHLMLTLMIMMSRAKYQIIIWDLYLGKVSPKKCEKVWWFANDEDQASFHHLQLESRPPGHSDQLPGYWIQFDFETTWPLHFFLVITVLFCKWWKIQLFAQKKKWKCHPLSSVYTSVFLK